MDIFFFFFYCSRAPCTPDPSVIFVSHNFHSISHTLQRTFQYEIFIVIVIISLLVVSFMLVSIDFTYRFIDGKLRYYFAFASLNNRYFCHSVIQKKKKKAPTFLFGSHFPIPAHICIAIIVLHLCERFSSPLDYTILTFRVHEPKNNVGGIFLTSI